MEELIASVNEVNVPNVAEYVSIYKMSLGVPVKMKSISNYDGSRGPCLELVFEDKNLKLWKTYFGDEEKVFTNLSKCAIIGDVYEKGTPMFCVPYAVKTTRSVFFVGYGV